MSSVQPIPTRLAAAAGLSRGQLRAKRWIAPFNGVRIDRKTAGDVRTVYRALKAVARVPIIISDRSAAAFYEWWLPQVTDALIEISVAPGHIVERPGVRCHRRVLDPMDVCEVDGITLTSPVRTILDLAGQLPLIDLVVVIDAALKKRSCTLEQLRARAYDRGVRGIARYRRALELCDGRSESPMETLMRLLIVLSGLPAPTPQFKAFDDFGVFVARMDLKAHGVRAAFEYDGVGHDEPVAHARDVKRWRDLRAAGYEVFPYTAGDLFRAPHLIVVDYQRALGLPLDASAIQGWLTEWKKSGYNR
jgi:hypothetical protein